MTFVSYKQSNSVVFQVEAILGQHGIVVISRSGSNPEKFIFDSDLLNKYKVCMD